MRRLLAVGIGLVALVVFVAAGGDSGDDEW